MSLRTVRFLFLAAILVGFSLTGICSAADVNLLGQRAVEDFTHHFTGDEIYSSGGVLQNDWAITAGPGPGVTTLSTTGTVVNMTTGTGGNGWLEGTTSTNGAQTWDSGVVGYGTPHTVEYGLHVNNADAGFTLWMGHDESRNNLTVYSDRITITQVGGGFTDVPVDFTSGFHSIRLAHDASPESFELVHVWVDGVRLTQDIGNPLTSGGDDPRLIIGDSTSGGLGDNLDVDFSYISYDTEGAFTPVPEPSTGLLAVVLGLAFTMLRRRVA